MRMRWYGEDGYFMGCMICCMLGRLELRDRKLIDLGWHGLPGKWYNTRHRYGGKETRRRQDEVFGCIPHGARACGESVLGL